MLVVRQLVHFVVVRQANEERLASRLQRLVRLITMFSKQRNGSQTVNLPHIANHFSRGWIEKSCAGGNRIKSTRIFEGGGRRGCIGGVPIRCACLLSQFLNKSTLIKRIFFQEQPLFPEGRPEVDQTYSIDPSC